MAILTARFAVALGPRRRARPVALRRAKRNNMLVRDATTACSGLLAGDTVPMAVKVAVVPHCKVAEVRAPLERRHWSRTPTHPVPCARPAQSVPVQRLDLQLFQGAGTAAAAVVLAIAPARAAPNANGDEDASVRHGGLRPTRAHAPPSLPVVSVICGSPSRVAHRLSIP
jgi:hypothetical protein